MNFVQILEHGAAHWPEKTAVVCGGQRVSYRALLERTRTLAAALAEAGLGPGDRAALACHNCVEYLTAVFACAWLGCVAVHLNVRSAAGELCALLAESGPKLLFLSARLGERGTALLEAMGPEGTVSVGGLLRGARSWEDFAAAGAGATPPRRTEGDGRVLMEYYTSGTTGRAKGVLHTHRAMVLHTLVNALEGGYTAETVYQFSSPLFHAAAAGAYDTLCAGGTLVLLDRTEPRSFLESLEREGVTFAGINPYLMRRLADSGLMGEYDLRALRRVSYAGAPVEPALLDRMMELLPGRDFVQYYGMTEMAPVVSVLGPEGHRDGARRYSAGKPALLVDLRVKAPDGADCPPGETGEVAVRGPCLMAGYSGGAAAPVRDGWYRTGDMGYLDREGYLFLVGRRDDIVVTGGENVSCAEVERCLLAQAGVAQAAVVGLPHPVWGQAVTAFVVAEDSGLTEAGLLAALGPLLGYKCPKAIHLLTDLPRNAGGKVDKQRLPRDESEPSVSPSGCHLPS